MNKDEDKYKDYSIIALVSVISRREGDLSKQELSAINNRFSMLVNTRLDNIITILQQVIQYIEGSSEDDVNFAFVEEEMIKAADLYKELLPARAIIMNQNKGDNMIKSIENLLFDGRI